MSVTTGGCLCRAIDFVVSAPPRTVHYCHCSMCRRATGGPFAVIAWFPRDAVQWKPFLPASFASSNSATRSFCPHCGTPICLQYNDSQEIGFMVGCLDDPNRFAPTYHYCAEDRLGWCSVD